jgi:anti-sigma regulatory factor (Ser/Thr protein kinase)
VTARTTNGSTYLEMEFTPDWGFINDVRTFVETFCERAQLVPERANALALSVHELLQNAVDYSTDGWARLRVEMDRAQRRVTLTVESHGTPEKVQQLEQLMKRFDEEPDPLKLYLALMRESSKRKGGSGLGLGRVRFEGGMNVSLEVSGGTVRVIATSSFDPPASLVDLLRAPRREPTHG